MIEQTVGLTLKDNSTLVGKVRLPDEFGELNKNGAGNEYICKYINDKGGINLFYVIQIKSQLEQGGNVTTHRFLLREPQLLDSVNVPVLVPYESIMFLTCGPFKNEIREDLEKMEQQVKKEMMLKKVDENNVIDV